MQKINFTVVYLVKTCVNIIFQLLLLTVSCEIYMVVSLINTQTAAATLQEFIYVIFIFDILSKLRNGMVHR